MIFSGNMLDKEFRSRVLKALNSATMDKWWVVAIEDPTLEPWEANLNIPEHTFRTGAKAWKNLVAWMDTQEQRRN